MAGSTPLSNYQLGDLLGRGASGNVYRALNFLTGETVAIKSISVASLPASSLPDLMSEIDLLKNLNHPNIVKYKGFAKDKENLFIVLEYCENGSLQSILKKFGKFPESLVAVYVSQVLEGLAYLHEQGVIHRDIKGANILTNKDGSVKLADFGVSSRAPAPDIAAVAAASVDADNEVVGSPYWMAPEIIEQSGASTASDVWSVGCVVVELLEGKPPYGDLAPMQALWRIVQDESMRIPEGASSIVKDFLYQCFQKDPNLRVSAKKLLRHGWMLAVKRNLAVETSKSGAVPRGKEKAPDTTDSSNRDGAVQEKPVAEKPVVPHSQALNAIQHWNEKLAEPTNYGTMRRLPTVKKEGKKEDNRSRGNSVAVPPVPPTPALSLGQQAASTAVGGVFQKNQHLSDVLSRARESSEAERWDDDYVFGDSIPKGEPSKSAESSSEEVHEKDHETVRPRKDTVKKDKKAKLKGIAEDYSDLVSGEDELELKLSHMKLREKGRIRLMHPDDLRKIGPLQATATARQPKPPPSLTSPTSPKAKKPSLPTLIPPTSKPPSPAVAVSTSSSPTISTRTPPGSRQSSLRGRNSVSAESTLELQKYTEADDEDYSDMFDGPAGQEDGTNTMGSLQLTRRSNRSWHEEEEEDDVDPFAEFDDDFDTDDLEANLLRDKKATLHAMVAKIVDQLEVGTPQATLRSLADELLSLFENTPPDLGLEAHFVTIHGMLAVLEVLESRLSRDVAVRLLKIVNFIVAFDVDNLESFCLVGGIPVIIPYTSKKHSLDTRLEASTFIQHLTRSPLTLQMFISCRGLKVLVELLDEDYSMNKTLILSAVEGIGSVFDLQSPTPKPDFCRMFTREGILDPLSTSLLAVSKDPEVEEETPRRAVDVLLLFCQVSQADNHVREAFATRTIMMRLLKALDILPRKLLVTAIKSVKHLATSPQLIEVLQNSNAMEVLVELLRKSLKGSYSNEICSHVFQTIYSMCRLSKARQEEAAAAGIIPLLKLTIDNKSQLKQFALPVLCDLANAGKVSRRLLWQNGGLTMYLDLLDDPYWRVSALEAVVGWMADETARVEDVLLEEGPTNSLIQCFAHALGVSFERVLDPFLKLLKLSTPLTTAMTTPPFLKRLAETLERQAKAMTKLNLLRITRVVFETHPEREALVSRFGFDIIVDRLAKQDGAVLVRELAKEIYPSLVYGIPAAAAPVPQKRSVSVMRRGPDGVALPVNRQASRHVRVSAKDGTGSSRGSPAPSISNGTGAGIAPLPPPRRPSRNPSHLGLEPVRGIDSRDPSRDTRESRDARSRIDRDVWDNDFPRSPSVSMLGPPKHARRLSADNLLNGIQTPLTTLDKRGKSRISRSYLKEVQWEAGENGRLSPVHMRSALRPRGHVSPPPAQTNGHH